MMNLGAASPRSTPRRDTTSGRGVVRPARSAPRRDASARRGVIPARPQEDAVELAHLRAGRREVRRREVVLHINGGRRPREGLRALLAQVAEQHLLRLDPVREGRGRHGRRFELLAVGREDPEGLVDDTAPLAEDPNFGVVTELGREAVLQYPRLDGGLVVNPLEATHVVQVRNPKLRHKSQFHLRFHGAPGLHGPLVRLQGAVK